MSVHIKSIQILPTTKGQTKIEKMWVPCGKQNGISQPENIDQISATLIKRKK